MPLQTPGEVDYVQATEVKRDAVGSQFSQAVGNVYREMYHLKKWVAENRTPEEDGLHDTAYGVDIGADADLDTEIGKAETANTSMFSTGLIHESQDTAADTSGQCRAR